MHLARVKCHDNSLAFCIDFDVVHAADFHERLPELWQGLVMGFSFCGNFNRFQNGVISPFGEEGVRRVRISRSRGVHGIVRFLPISYASKACDGRLFGQSAAYPAFATRERDRLCYFAISRAIGSSTRQTFWATICWPRVFG